MIKAVILAGYNDRVHGLHNKATCMIGGKMMVEYVIEALEKSQCVDRIVIIGDKKKLQVLENKELEVVQCSSSLVDNVLLGIKYFQGEQVLVSTSDIPMVTEEAIRDFVLKGQETEADLAYSVISKKRMVEKYPQAHRTYVKLKDGEFTGGNLFLVNSSKVDGYVEVGKRMIAYRSEERRVGK